MESLENKFRSDDSLPLKNAILIPGAIKSRSRQIFYYLCICKDLSVMVYGRYRRS